MFGKRWLVLVLAVLCGITAAGPAPADGPPLPDDLKMIPPDTFGFVTVRGAEIAKTDLVRRIRRELGTNGAIGKELAGLAGQPGPEALIANLLNATGGGFGDLNVLGDVERMTTFFRPGSGKDSVVDYGQIWLTYKPYDRAKLAAGLKGAREKSHAGKTYLLADENDSIMPAVHFVSDRIFVRGNEPTVRWFITSKAAAAPEPLAGLIREAATGTHLVAALDGTGELARAVVGQAGQLGKEFEFLAGIQTLTLTARIGRTTEFRARAVFKEAGQAKQAAGLAKTGLSAGREFLEEAARQKPPPGGQLERPMMVKLAGHLARELRNAAVEQTDRAAEVVIPVKADGLTEDFENAVVGATLEAVTAVRNAASRTVTQNNLKQIAIALHSFHDGHGALPPPAICDKAGKPLLSWRVAILPFVEEQALYKQFKLDEPWDSDHNKKLIAKMPKVYAMRGVVSAKGAQKRDYDKIAADGLTFYQVLVGPGAAFELQPAPKAMFNARGLPLVAFADGTSNTIMAAEAADAVVWTKPADLEYAANKPLPKFGEHHQGVFTVLMGDGSVRTLKVSISPKTLRAAITRAGGEVLGDDW